MGLFNSGSNQAYEQYLPVPPKKAFEALCQAVDSGSQFTLKEADDFALTAIFTSGISLATYGQRFNAQIVPSGDASSLRVTAVAKVGGSLFNAARAQKLVDAVFSGASDLLRPQARR
ncbi:MAG TPA: hypothetical protein VFQ96_03805 [Microbacteriaceae bacterium]|nr:hypothetical protein [Microbacteriaceae bacterium]